MPAARTLDAATAVRWFADAIKRKERRPDVAAVKPFVETVNRIIKLAALDPAPGEPSREAKFRIQAAIKRMKKPVAELQAALRDLSCCRFGGHYL